MCIMPVTCRKWRQVLSKTGEEEIICIIPVTGGK